MSWILIVGVNRMKPEDLERNFGFLISDVSRLLKNDYDRRVSHTGLTRSQWWVLNQLYREEGTTQAELADRLEIERPALGRLLDRLEAKGWITREVDATDRRAKRVYLTEEVAPIMSDMRRHAAALRADAIADIDDADVQKMVDILIRIKANVVERLQDDDDTDNVTLRQANA